MNRRSCWPKIPSEAPGLAASRVAVFRSPVLRSSGVRAPVVSMACLRIARFRFWIRFDRIGQIAKIRRLSMLRPCRDATRRDHRATSAAVERLLRWSVGRIGG